MAIGSNMVCWVIVCYWVKVGSNMDKIILG